MGKSLASIVLETAPPSIITVSKRSPSLSKLDTIQEESSLGLFEPELATSLSNIQLDWKSSAGQAHSNHQIHGSSYVICAQ